MIKLIAAIDLLRGIATDKLELDSISEYINNRKTYISDVGKFSTLIKDADELCIIQVSAILDCDNFFPSFEKDFILVKKGSIKRENGIEYQPQIWKRK